MKGSVSRADTARVLAAVAAVVRDVRTAVAVNRVLETATPSICGPGTELGRDVTKILCAESGIEPAQVGHYADCECEDAQIPRDGLGGHLAVKTQACAAGDSCEDPCCQTRWQPWVVSPHRFDRGEK